MTTFRFIAAKRTEHSTSIMCRVLEVSRSGYHAWTTRPMSARAVEDARLTRRIRELFPLRRSAHGSPQIWSDLVLGDGERIGRKRVERLMRLAGLSAVANRKWRGTPSRVPGVRVADDLVDRTFSADAPNQILGCRHHPPADLAGLALPDRRARPLQPSHRRLVDGRPHGHRARDRRTREGPRPPAPRPWADLASDQGAQFVSLAFGQKARAAGIAQSMGREGDCFDNAVAESFFATLKTELIHRRSWPTKAELRTELFDRIEVFYNRERRHSRLGHQPVSLLTRGFLALELIASQG